MKLRELTEVITKGTTPTTLGFPFISSGVNFIKIENITTDNKFDIKNINYISKECHEKLKRSQLKCGDILFSIAGVIGRCAIVDDSILPANINQAISIIRLSDKYEVDKNYLIKFLQSEKIIGQYLKMQQGVAQLNLSLANIGDFDISLPPLPDQQRIAAELDTVCGAIAKQKKQFKLCDDLIKSKFNEMFGELPCNESLRNVCKFINGDRSINYPKGDDYANSGIPFINAGDIYDGYLSDAKFNFITQKAFDRLSSGKVQIGDILYCLRGSLGKHCIVDIKKGAIASSLVILRVNSEKMLSEYLNELLYSQIVEKQMLSANNGSSQPNLSAESVKNYKIPLPSLPLQKQFADFVTCVEQNKAKIKQGLNETETLYKALMQKYFGGEDAE